LVELIAKLQYETAAMTTPSTSGSIDTSHSPGLSTLALLTEAQSAL
jgi:hypothetical protein